MPRSHPPTLLRLTERLLRDELRLKEGQRLLLAVSGGLDSMALLHVMSRLGPKLGLEVAAHGVDHGLREEAADELDRAERYARQLGIPWSRSVLSVKPGGNLHHRAREARYRALEAEAQRHPGTLIATAHHADDRAETVLIRLLRGSGLRGLGVLPPRSRDRVRPFVRASRLDISRHAERHQVPYSVDPSNQNRRFLRTRIREDLLPRLTELSPAVVEHLCALSDACAGLQEEAIDQGSGPASGEAGVVGSAVDFEPSPPREFFVLARAHIGAIEALVRARRIGGRVAIGGGLELKVDRKGAGPGKF